MIAAMRRIAFVLSASSALLAFAALVMDGCDADDPAEVGDAALDTLAAIDGGAEDAIGPIVCKSYPGLGDPCSATAPCAAPLDCFYAPGCDLPKGSCQIWDHCPDVAVGDAAFCGCEGGGASNRGPYAYAGPCHDAAPDGD